MDNRFDDRGSWRRDEDRNRRPDDWHNREREQRREGDEYMIHGTRHGGRRDDNGPRDERGRRWDDRERGNERYDPRRNDEWERGLHTIGRGPGHPGRDGEEYSRTG